MTTRRDNPDGALWRLAVEGFNRILVDDASKSAINSGLDSGASKPARTRIWKEVADVYEVFLVGYCGRALPSDDSFSTVDVKADESLEMTVLDVLGDRILKSPIDAPSDVSFSPAIILRVNCKRRKSNIYVFGLGPLIWGHVKRR